MYQSEFEYKANFKEVEQLYFQKGRFCEGEKLLLNSC